jgi:hypothetical protein
VTLTTAVLLLTGLPLIAALPLIVAMISATYLTPLPVVTRRGPGNWRNLSDPRVFATRRGPKVPGGLLDVGNPLGFCLFIAGVAILLVVATSLFVASAARGACLVTEALALIPVFFTGRAAQLPALPIVRARPLLKSLYNRLHRDPDVQLSVLGRFPQGAKDPDELRLMVLPQNPLLGLGAIEVACEIQHSFAGPMAVPVVLVRAVDGSPSYEALPHSVVWSRGRTPNERACIVRPKIPSVGATVVLLRQLAQMLCSKRPIARSKPSSDAVPAASGGPSRKLVTKPVTA